MKRQPIRGCGRLMIVAPFAGAWIETHDGNFRHGNHRGVAPFAGAWIETLDPRGDRQNS